MKQATVAELEASGADPFDALLTLEDHFLASGFAAGAQASQSQPDVAAAYGDLSTRAQASCMVVKRVKRQAGSSDTRKATSSALSLDSTEDASTRYLPFQLRTQALHPHGAPVCRMMEDEALHGWLGGAMGLMVPLESRVLAGSLPRSHGCTRFLPQSSSTIHSINVVSMRSTTCGQGCGWWTCGSKGDRRPARTPTPMVVRRLQGQQQVVVVARVI